MNAETNDSVPNADGSITAAAPIPPSKPSLAHKTFIGPDGLRAGWSLLIFIALFAALGYGVSRIALAIYTPPKEAHMTEHLGPLFLVNEAVPFLLVLLITWIMSRIERRPNSVYGLGGRRKLPLFFAGLFWGIACLSVLILVLWKSGVLVFEGRMMFGNAVLEYGAIWFVGFLLVGLLEEYLTRGYMQYTLTRGLAGLYQRVFKTEQSEAMGFWTAAVVFSILFGLGHSHNPGESPIGLLSAGLAGMVFCYSLWRTGSLWWAIGFHASWDWGQSFFYGVADSGMMLQRHWLKTHPAGRPLLSGGTTGPEGSIYILAIFVLIAVIIAVTLPRNPNGYLQKRALPDVIR